jgi:phosphoglycerol transferase MdoB-like AlkP superfamily enzyme
MTSIYSVSQVCPGKEYGNNTYFQSVFNLYNDKDYVTFSAHNYTEFYYPRTKFHANMGSGDYYGVERLGIPYSNEYINWSNDDEFLEKVVNIIKTKRTDDKKFMTWLTTVSSHQPYGVDSIQGNKYYSMTKGTQLPSDVRRYMSKLKIVDNALGVLLKGLEQQGILDDTVIVMYGDHYPYGLPTNHLNKALPYDTAEDKNAEKVPFIIYNSQLEKKEFKQYTTYVNILPTIANLFNLDYEPKMMLGSDILSKDYESLVVFADGSWKNENAYYDASSRKVKYYNDKYSEEDVLNITQDVGTKLKVSTQVIESDYFSFIGRVLSNVETENNVTPFEVDEKICDNGLSS